MAYCGPGDRLIDPPDHFKGDRIPHDTGTAWTYMFFTVACVQVNSSSVCLSVCVSDSLCIWWAVCFSACMPAFYVIIALDVYNMPVENIIMHQIVEKEQKTETLSTHVQSYS